MSENQTCLLANRECIPCKGGVPPLAGEMLRHYQAELGGNWELIDEQRLEKTFKLKNFREALDLTIRIGELAESVGHHPDIFLTWGKVKLTIWTHKISGLTESDFVLAAKVDQLALG